MQHLQYFYKVKNDNEYVTLFKKENINVSMNDIVQ